MTNIFKKLLTPETNNTKDVEAVQLWYIRWHARDGEFSGSTYPVVECFTSEKEALDFKKSLENAFRLIKHTSGTAVSISKN